jgi:hypothetical protein
MALIRQSLRPSPAERAPASPANLYEIGKVIRGADMSRKASLCAGIEQEGRSPARHRAVAVVQLITTAALAFSTAVAVTAVSIGMARADVAGGAGEAGGMALTFASLVGLALFAMGGLGAMRADAARSD